MKAIFRLKYHEGRSGILLGETENLLNSCCEFFRMPGATYHSFLLKLHSLSQGMEHVSQSVTGHTKYWFDFVFTVYYPSLWIWLCARAKSNHTREKITWNVICKLQFFISENWSNINLIWIVYFNNITKFEASEAKRSKTRLACSSLLTNTYSSYRELCPFFPFKDRCTAVWDLLTLLSANPPAEPVSLSKTVATPSFNMAQWGQISWKGELEQETIGRSNKTFFTSAVIKKNSATQSNEMLSQVFKFNSGNDLLVSYMTLYYMENLD